MRSKLGWNAYGPSGPGNVNSEMVTHHLFCPVSNQRQHDLLKSHLTLEESGIFIAWLSVPEEDIRVNGDRFETVLLGKDDNTEFPDSYPIAVERLMCLEKRLRKDPRL